MRKISRSHLAFAILLAGMMASILIIFIGQIVKFPAKTDVLAAVADCNPVGDDCAAHVNGLNIMLNLGDEMRPLKTFPVRVRFEGAGADAVRGVTVDFSMPGMDMGVNRFGLALGEDSVWRGQAMLPVCGSGSLNWQARVEVIGEHDYAGKFAFDVERP